MPCAQILRLLQGNEADEPIICVYDKIPGRQGAQGQIGGELSEKDGLSWSLPASETHLAYLSKVLGP